MPDSAVIMSPMVRSSSDAKRASQRRIGMPSHVQLLIPLVVFVGVLIALTVLPLSSPTEQSLTNRLQAPAWLSGNWDRPLGTDGLGRDLLSRIAQGARTSLQIACIAAIFSAAIGSAIGMASGLLGKWVDNLLTILAEVSLALPTIVVGVVLTATLGQSTRNLICVLVFSGWIAFARVVRLQTRQLAQSEFVLASRMFGASSTHVAWKHLIPHLAGTMLVLFFQQLGGMMLWESSLTYLGLGGRPDMITLGSIVREGQEQIFSAWWISTFSGGTLAFAIVALALFGDWLRRTFDTFTYGKVQDA